MWAQSCVKAPAGSKLYVSCCVAKVEAYVSATWIGLNERPRLVLSRFCVRHCRGSSRKRSENKVTFKRATGKKGKGFGRSKEKKRLKKGTADDALTWLPDGCNSIAAECAHAGRKFRFHQLTCEEQRDKTTSKQSVTVRCDTNQEA